MDKQTDSTGAATAPTASAHTPGPWQIEDEFTIRSSGDDIAPVIAEVWCVDGEEERVSANARLIAAAPDMLAALQAVIADVDVEQGADVAPDVVAAVRAAIEQAAPVPAVATPVETGKADPSRIGQELRSTEGEALTALVAEWRHNAKASLTNSQNERIPELDRRQCFGVSQAYEQCADELEALLTARASSPPPPVSPDWQPIESAPKDRDVLIAKFEPRLDWDKAHWWDGNFQNPAGWRVRSELAYPTHWLPLPVPPSASADEISRLKAESTG